MATRRVIGIINRLKSLAVKQRLYHVLRYGQKGTKGHPLSLQIVSTVKLSQVFLS